MNKLVFEFLENVEEFHHLGAHAKYFDAWADDTRKFADDSGLLETEEDKKTLDMALRIRGMVHEASVGGSEAVQGVPASNEAWKWLMTANQVEQRTQEWYAETRSILTASEVAAVFKGGRTRGSLVMSKAAPPNEVRGGGNLAVERRSTGPMDWGVRYEPAVKEHLEKTLGCKIHDLGRIRHRTDPRIAASPDGLIISCEKDAGLVGRLVEIKCPSTRVIKDGVISFEYWCQMQLQMEVCGVDACEFVEVKFREYELADPDVSGEPSASSAIDSGRISLLSNTETGVNKYVYAYDPSVALEENWALVEAYCWDIIQLRRVTVLRDVNWFAKSQPDFAAFWADVEGARAGTWTLPPGRPRKEKVVVEPVSKCDIVDDST